MVSGPVAQRLSSEAVEDFDLPLVVLGRGDSKGFGHHVLLVGVLTRDTRSCDALTRSLDAVGRASSGIV